MKSFSCELIGKFFYRFAIFTKDEKSNLLLLDLYAIVALVRLLISVN